MTITVNLNNVADLTNTVTAQNTINTNSSTITTAFQSALNTSGDKMNGALDMNNNHILNLPAPASQHEPARLADISTASISISLPSITGVVSAPAGTGVLNTIFTGTGNLPVSQLASGAGATNTTFFRGDGTWASPTSISLTSGNNIVVGTGSPVAVSVQTTLNNYTYLQGPGATGASVLIGNATDTSVYFRAGTIFVEDYTTNGVVAKYNITSSQCGLALGVAGTVAGLLTLNPAIGTSGPTIAPSNSGTAYNLFLPTSLGTSGTLFMSQGNGAAHIYTPSVWPSSVSVNNAVLVSTSTNVWSATALAPNQLSPGAVAKVKVQVFTASSATYTPSSGLLYAIVECVGGGGGGGGSAATATSNVFGGGGGGGAGYSRKYIASSVAGTSQTVTVGAGGAGAVGTSTAGVTGSAGGTTSFGSISSALGGSGGFCGCISQIGVGGSGGNGTGDVVSIGGPGNCGIYFIGGTSGASVGFGEANGGFSHLGGGAAGTSGAGNITGISATGYGGGGSGALSSSTSSGTPVGGTGASGICVVTEFCNQ